MAATNAAQPQVNSPAPRPGEEAPLPQLVEMMDSMLAVLEQETQLVRAGRLTEAADLERTKADLAQRYMAATARLKASKATLEAAAPDLLDALRRRHDLFRAQLQVNLTVLATAHAVSEGIMRGVSNELARKAAPSTYGAGGRANAPAPHAAQPLAVSRVL